MLCHRVSVVVNFTLRRSFSPAAAAASLTSNPLTPLQPLQLNPLSCQPVSITAAGCCCSSAGKIFSGLRHTDKQRFHHLSRRYSSSSVNGGGGVAEVGGLAGWYEGLAASAPVQLAGEFLVGFQQASGLPWWLSIACSSLALRSTITLPLAAYQMIIISKVERLQTEIAELAKRLRYEVSVRARERNWTDAHCRYQFKKNLRRIVSELYVRDNCHPFKASLLVWVQVPLWISMSLALRNLSVNPGVHTALSTGGALWLTNLTLPDHTWIIPVCLGLLNLFLVEIFVLQRKQTSRSQKIITNIFRGVSILMVPVAASVPSCLSLYWLSSSAVGLSHNLLLRSPRVHKLLKLQTPGSTRSETPYRDLAAAFRTKYFG